MMTSTTKPELRLGTSTYSYWHFTPEKTPIETAMQKSVAMLQDAWEQAIIQ